MKMKMKMKITLLIILLSIFTTPEIFSQANSYNCYLKNITEIDSKTLDFDIWLDWTGTNIQKLESFAAGINFNYTGMANGGIITGAIIPGSADNSLPVNQRSPNWNINAVSQQIRLLPVLATPSSIAATIPPPPGFRLGTFRMTNTVDFTPGSSPDFEFKFITGTGTTTQTKLQVYLNGATLGTDVTDVDRYFIEGNPTMNINDLILLNQSIIFFPNPAVKNISVLIEDNNFLQELIIYNVTGQKVTTNYSAVINSKFIDVDISTLQPGIYFLEIIYNTEKRIGKFVKE